MVIPSVGTPWPELSRQWDMGVLRRKERSNPLLRQHGEIAKIDGVVCRKYTNANFHITSSYVAPIPGWADGDFIETHMRGCRQYAYKVRNILRLDHSGTIRGDTGTGRLSKFRLLPLQGRVQYAELTGPG